MENKGKEVGLVASLLVMLLVTLLGCFFMASWWVMDSSIGHHFDAPNINLLFVVH